jgi:hypothetical protein
MLAFKIIMACISEPLILSGVFNKVYLKSNQTRIQKQLKNKSQQKVGDQSTDKDAETAKSSIYPQHDLEDALSEISAQ